MLCLKSFRKFFFSQLKGDVLEIGPFNRPVVKNARYFDIYDKKGLTEAAYLVGRDVTGIPEIDYVDPNGDLSVIPDQFDFVVSAHVIEHQPDLIEHLTQVCSLLRPHGEYWLAIPDKRFCFDHFFKTSSKEEVLAAVGSRSHSWDTVLRHYTMTTHNNARKHWIGMHQRVLSECERELRCAAARVAFESGEYVDAHAWQFTPKSFEVLMSDLSEVTGLRVAEVFDTPPLHQEFMAILVK